MLSRKTRSLLRLRILDRYVIREVLPPSGLGLLLFTFVVLLQQVTLLTGLLISRGADLATTLKLFINFLPSIFAITIPMAFLLGLLLAFGRLASESEIVAMRASGISALQMFRPVLILSLAATALTFWVITVAVPHANTVFRETLYTLVISKARSEIKPRVFTDEVLPSMVLYVSDVAADTGEWKNVFISDMRRPDRPQILMARTGHLAIDEKDKAVTLHLEQGYTHGYDRSNPKDYNLEYFRTGDFQLPFDQIFPKIPLTKGGREMTLDELRDGYQVSEAKSASLARQGKTAEAQFEHLKAATFRVELHKKFSIPVACIVFGLLGLGLSLGSRKEARSAAFGLSIAVISVYYVFLRLGEQAGDTGMVAPWLGMWGANIVMGAAGILLVWMNQREAAFDPLNPRHYATWIPRVRRRLRQPTSEAAAAARVPPLPPLRRRLQPSLLDRYVARQYLEFAVLILVGFWSIFFLFHFMDLINDVNKNHVRGSKVLHFYAFYSPEIVHLITPLVVLVATLTTFGVLSRRNEITAMMAGGISIYRATVPVLLMGLLASGALFVAGEFILPSTTRIQERDFNEIKGRPLQPTNLLERRWVMAGDGRVYNYDYMSSSEAPGPHHAANAAPAEPSFYGLSIFELDPQAWNVSGRLYAGRARWVGSGYDLERGWRWTFRGRNVKFDTFDGVRTREMEPPETFIHPEEPSPASMPFLELRSHIASLQVLGVDVAKLQVQLHRKLAFPLVAVIMSLLGVRFSFTVGRRGALFGIALSIVIAILYWVCMSLFEQMGNNAILPPAIAAWAPNILFGASGFYLMLTLET